ncbi:MAG: hypothetical protein RLZZ360_444 [Candidatus Parcubacteria bacterium]|jgi:hypothetical protein
MVPIYIFRRKDGIKDSILLTLMESTQEYEGGLFQQIKTAPFKALATFVEEGESAKYVMIPHNYFAIEHDAAYLAEAATYAKQIGAKLFVFAYGDSAEPIVIDNAIIIRSSAYSSQLRSNEIIMPAFVEDIGEQFGVHYREKVATVPTIGFAGWVRFNDWKQEYKYQVKIWCSKLAIWFLGAPQPSLQGLYYRRQAINYVNQAKRVTGRFIMRGSYSGSVKTVEADPIVIRQQFVESITEADLSLVVRGDGNFSLRFFEVLSLGRIPVFVDTDTPLPRATEIEYDSFMIRVPHDKLSQLDKIVGDFWDICSPEQFLSMQQKARQAFTTKLRADRFFTDLFATL